jgi:hypothetical protein
LSCHGHLKRGRAITKRVPGAKRGRPPGHGGWNDSRLEALRRYYEGIVYVSPKRSDVEIARLIYDKWRKFRPWPHKKGRTFSSEWAIRYRLPRVRELMWREEQFERHCGGLLGLIDTDEPLERSGLPDGVDWRDLVGDDFVYEPGEY